MLSSVTWLLFPTFFGQLFAGTFVGDVKVEYNKFSLLESEGFEIKCTATHQDKRPELRWYLISTEFTRTNITNFESTRGKGNTAENTLRRSSARLSYSGDYFCEARLVDELTGFKNIKSSRGVPILVLPASQKPRVVIRRTVRSGVVEITCLVQPIGLGETLKWTRDDEQVISNERVSELTILPTSGHYTCIGNLTIGGYSFYQSSASISGAIDVKPSFVSIATMLVCFAITLANWFAL